MIYSSYFSLQSISCAHFAIFQIHYLKKITFNYLYARVSIHTNVLEMPEEGVRSYGAELKVILSFLMRMLETIVLSHLSSTLLIFKPSIKYDGVFSTLIL